jgi:hypothetical protein
MPTCLTGGQDLQSVIMPTSLVDYASRTSYEAASTHKLYKENPHPQGAGEVSPLSEEVSGGA